MMMRSALLLAQHSYLGASSLKQQSTDIYDVKHQLINQVLSREATHTCTNFIVFGLIWSRHEPTIYHTRSEHANHYTTDAVLNLRTKRLKNKQYLTHVEGLNQPERNPNRTNHDWHV